MLAKTGLIAMIGKAERGPVAIEAIRRHRAAYLMAVGGAAYLVSKAIRKSRVVAFADLGMEAIYEFDVVDMPVTVAVDANGESVHEPVRANGSSGSAAFRWSPADALRATVSRAAARRRQCRRRIDVAYDPASSTASNVTRSRWSAARRVHRRHGERCERRVVAPREPHRMTAYARSPAPRYRRLPAARRQWP